MFLQVIDDRELVLLGDQDLDLRGGVQSREALEEAHRVALVAAENNKQPGRRQGGVIKAVPVFGEKDVAAHLAGQQCAGFLHARLHQRVAGAPHFRLAAGLADHIEQFTGAFDVEDHLGAGHPGGQILGQGHEQNVRVDHLAVGKHHAEPVAITVEGQAQVGALLAHGVDEVVEGFDVTRVRVVVGEGAVHVRVQRHHVAAQQHQCFRGGHTGGAVAAVHHHLERARQLVAALHGVQVGGQHVPLLAAALAFAEIALLNAGLEGLDGVAGQGGALNNHLEAVVVRRVVAAGDHYAGVGVVVVVGGEIQHRGGHQAQIHHFAAAGLQAVGEAVHQRRGRQSAVAAHRHGVAALAAYFSADGQTDQAGGVVGEGVLVNAANVVGAEQGAGKSGGHTKSF